MSNIEMRSAKRAVLGRSHFVMALILSVVLGIVGKAAAEQGMISEVAGQVEIGRGNPPAFTKAVAGDRVNPGDTVRTGKQGRVELRLAAGTVRLYENSLLRIPANPAAGHQLEMERGRSIFDIIKASVRDRFEVRTPEVVVSVKGTRFEVNLVGELAEVAVFRGIVGVRAPDAALEFETLVREGFAAIGSADVPFDLDLTPRVDPWDSWAKLESSRETAMNMRHSERKLRMREAAQSSARRSSAKQLVGIASERNPKLARKIEQMRKDRLAQARRDQRAPGSDMRSQDVPASLGNLPSDLDPQEYKHKYTAMALRDKNLVQRHMEVDVGVPNIVAEIGASQENFQLIETLAEGGSSADLVPGMEDPGSTIPNTSFDPTPDVSMMEVASILDTMSYEGLITVWYQAVEELQVADPSLFMQSDPAAYQAALKNKFMLIGFSVEDADLVSKLIASKIQP